jgi:hypothetical protein
MQNQFASGLKATPRKTKAALSVRPLRLDDAGKVALITGSAMNLRL